MNPILSRSLFEISSLLRRGEISSTNLTKLYLERIEAVNPKYQAYIHVSKEAALQQAAKADAALAAGEVLGPLHGVPVAVKDLCETDFAPTSNGMACLRDNHTKRQSQVVANLLAAGAVILGKLAMAEGACSAHHPEMPVPINPLGDKFRVGSSSSGSGVAVAAQMCAAAIGSDTGGSIRFPSAYCGLFGLKPTYGLISVEGVMPMSPSLDHIGPMARSLEDCRLMLTALLGDQQAPASEGKITRLSYDPSLCETRLHPEITAAYLAMVNRLRANVDVIERRLPQIDDLDAVWTKLCAYEIAQGHAETYARHEADYGHALAQLIRQGQSIPDAEYQAAKRRQQEIKQIWLDFIPPHEALLLPIHAAPPPLQDNTLGAPSQSAANPLEFTQAGNVTGLPSLALPAGRDSRGCPMGLQLMGRPFSDYELLALADIL